MTRKTYPEHSTRDEEEQAIHDLVIRKMAERLEETTGMDVLTNEGEVENNGIEFDEEAVVFPDIMCVEDESIRYVCEVETESTITDGALDQWKDFAAFDGAEFILVVPETHEDDAKALIEEHDIECNGLVLYEPSVA